MSGPGEAEGTGYIGEQLRSTLVQVRGRSWTCSKWGDEVYDSSPSLLFQYYAISSDPATLHYLTLSLLLQTVLIVDVNSGPAIDNYSPDRQACAFHSSPQRFRELLVLFL